MAHEHTHEHEEHGHRHDHGDGGHTHDHEHRSGIPGWFQHTFAHSHDIHEKVDDVMESNERGVRATKWALVSFSRVTLES